MASAGAKGETLDQMVKVLHHPKGADAHAGFAELLKQLNAGDPKKRGYELSIANALWGHHDSKWLPEFLSLTKDRYGAGLRPVDFLQPEAARQTINKWVEEQTRDKIKDLFPPGVIDSDTRLVLTNAVYFKGSWTQPFRKGATADGMFRLNEKDTVKVPLMHGSVDGKHVKNADVEAAELPYGNKDLAMVVLLPPKVDGLADLEKKLTADTLTQWLGGLKPAEDMNVTLPKFKMTDEFELKEALGKLGMKNAFVPGAADFAGLNGGSPKLFISAVRHKAFVDVNEEGTEAAAATGISVGLTSARITPNFVADRPFLFLIRDTRSGSVLFLGRVVNPAK
jgi:serpin B